MVNYSTNWMGPVSTRWYEDRNIPYTLKKTSGKVLPVVEYKEFEVQYACGRVDIYGLQQDEYWEGKSEYGVPPMVQEDWNLLSDFLRSFETENLMSYADIISTFEESLGRSIRWWR